MRVGPGEIWQCAGSCVLGHPDASGDMAMRAQRAIKVYEVLIARRLRFLSAQGIFGLLAFLTSRHGRHPHRPGSGGWMPQ